MHHGTVHVREPVVPTLDTMGELGVIEAEQMKESGVEVVHMNGVGDHIEAKVIGGSMDVPCSDSPAGEPDGKRAVMVVAAILSPLDHRGSPEFAPPHHERVIEQATLLEVGHESRRSPIGLAAVLFHVLGEVVVLVPRLVEELNESNAALEQSAGE